MSDRAEQAKALIERLSPLAYEEWIEDNGKVIERAEAIELLAAALTASEAEVTRLETGIAEALGSEMRLRAIVNAAARFYLKRDHALQDWVDNMRSAGVEVDDLEDLATIIAEGASETPLSHPTTDTNGAHA